jgi:hypothetical protein
MSRRVNQVLWEQWGQRVDRQRASGLSIAEFCRREGVSSVTFHTWKRKLQGTTVVRSGATEAASGRGAAKVSAAITRRRRSGPVRADGAAPTGTANFVQVPVLGSRMGLWIELTLVDGTIVRIPQQNLAALQTVFTILRGGAVAPLLGEVSHA